MQTADATLPTPERSLSKAWVWRLNWGLLSLLCVALDYVSGPVIQFPLFYLLPVSLMAWYDGRGWGVALAVVLSLARLGFRLVWNPPWTVLESAVSAGIRMVVFAGFAWLVARTAEQMRHLRHTRQMEAMLGVCSVCRKIHDRDINAWQPLDEYLSSRQQAFERGLCPSCRQELEQTFDRR